jgi:hypothetical protein
MRDVVWSSSRTRVYKANHCDALEWGPLELICRTARPTQIRRTPPPCSTSRVSLPRTFAVRRPPNQKGGSSPLGRSISHQLDSPYIVSLSHHVLFLAYILAMGSQAVPAALSLILLFTRTSSFKHSLRWLSSAYARESNPGTISTLSRMAGVLELYPLHCHTGSRAFVTV